MKQNKEEQEHGVQFLSDEFHDLAAGRKKTWDQIKRLSSKLDTISSQVDRISQAIDSFERYSYQYNQFNTIKIFGIPQVAETEPFEDTPSIRLKLYSHVLEQISQFRISSHTGFRQNQLRPTDRILLFVDLSCDYLRRSHVGNKSDQLCDCYRPSLVTRFDQPHWLLQLLYSAAARFAVQSQTL